MWGWWCIQRNTTKAEGTLNMFLSLLSNADYHGLHKWSVDKFSEVWKAVLKFTDVIYFENFG